MQPDEQPNQPGNLNPTPPAGSAAPQWSPAQGTAASPQTGFAPSPESGQPGVIGALDSSQGGGFAQGSQGDSQPPATAGFGFDGAGSTTGPQVFVSPDQPQPSSAQPAVPQMPAQPVQGAMPAMPPAGQMPMPPADMPTSGQMPMMPGGSPSGRSKMLRIIIIVVAIIVVAALGFFGWSKLQNKNTQNKNASDANKAAQSNTASGATDISKLASFTFAQPAAADLDGLVAGQSVNGLTVFGTSDGQCELGFGKVSQTDLPGTTIGDVVSRVITKAKSTVSGITVTGPNTVAARVLKGSDGKKYSLPTVNYSFTGSQASTSFSSDVTYSISQLSDGSHAVVLLECSDTTANDQSALSARVSTLDPVANAVTVQVQ